MKNNLCIYHGNCADGFTAAWAFWSVVKDGFDFHPGVYGNPPPDVANKHVVIVDFSYPADTLAKMADSAASLLILDHHKTAAETLSSLPQTGSLDEWALYLDTKLHNNGRPVGALFDMERSGAGIAWDFFHKGDPRPKLIDYVEDRDLWRFHLPFSREVNANIFSNEYTFENWDMLRDRIDNDLFYFIAEGAAIERKHHKDIAELVAATKRHLMIGGLIVPVCNLPYTLTSDAGSLMCQQEPEAAFAACYWDTPEGRVFSLRSRGDGTFDVAKIAQQYGGGGHKNAAGFRLPHGVQP